MDSKEQDTALPNASGTPPTASGGGHTEVDDEELDALLNGE